MHASPPSDAASPPLLIASSESMRNLLNLVTRAANSEATVLIQGETGTGKEIIARTIHHHSPRSSGPFVAVNCGASTDSLLASELFGHVRGAFTGAVSERAGVFESASNGTVFLDEISAMSPTMQIKVLRVLQERIVTRVGASQETPVNVRVVAATNTDLTQLVQSGAFREDLYYRIKVVLCKIPPLRERTDDIKPLVDHYLAQFAAQNAKRNISLHPDTLRSLVRFHWPGNVRQLVGEVEQLVAMADDDATIGPDRLSDEFRNPVTTAPTPNTPAPVQTDRFAASYSPDATYQEMIDTWTKDVVARRLTECGGNISKTAQSLSVSRSTLYALLNKYGMRGSDD
jgi:transcriptional regulator with PAS, ATPase and Fis domain